MSVQRKSDELLLRMLQLRSAGLCVTEIAASVGKSRQFVSTATNRVMRADLAESGEPAKLVGRSYW